MNRMIPDSIASEPRYGWRNNINQSKVALEWLNWCDHQLRNEEWNNLSKDDRNVHNLMACAYPDYDHPTTRNHIQHVGNSGEYKVPNICITVDGYDAEKQQHLPVPRMLLARVPNLLPGVS